MSEKLKHIPELPKRIWACDSAIWFSDDQGEPEELTEYIRADLVHADAELAKMHHAQAFGAGVDHAAPQWKPIETAPKDHPILLYGGQPDHHHDDNHDHVNSQPKHVVGWWGHDTWRYTSYDSGFYGDWIDPTHWMPLPAPPTE